MITARFFTTESEQYSGFCGFEVSGHAAFEVQGRDILCAAVSALTQAAVIGLEQVVRCPLEVEVDRGYLFCRVKHSLGLQAGAWREAQVIFETTYLALMDIGEQYSERLSLIKVGGE